jgi:hypothetical protein
MDFGVASASRACASFPTSLHSLELGGGGGAGSLAPHLWCASRSLLERLARDCGRSLRSLTLRGSHDMVGMGNSFGTCLLALTSLAHLRIECLLGRSSYGSYGGAGAGAPLTHRDTEGGLCDGDETNIGAIWLVRLSVICFVAKRHGQLRTLLVRLYAGSDLDQSQPGVLMRKGMARLLMRAHEIDKIDEMDKTGTTGPSIVGGASGGATSAGGDGWQADTLPASVVAARVEIGLSV